MLLVRFARATHDAHTHRHACHVAGISEHQACRLDYESGKVMLTKPNTFKHLWAHYMMSPKFQKRRDAPTVVEIFQDMLNTHMYLVSVGMLSQSGRMTELVAQIQWKCAPRSIEPLA